MLLNLNFLKQRSKQSFHYKPVQLTSLHLSLLAARIVYNCHLHSTTLLGPLPLFIAFQTCCSSVVIPLFIPLHVSFHSGLFTLRWWKFIEMISILGTFIETIFIVRYISVLFCDIPLLADNDEGQMKDMFQTMFNFKVNLPKVYAKTQWKMHRVRSLTSCALNASILCTLTVYVL